MTKAICDYAAVVSPFGEIFISSYGIIHGDVILNLREFRNQWTFPRSFKGDDIVLENLIVSGPISCKKRKDLLYE